MGDELLDILRGLSQRRGAESDINGVSVESNYAKNDINQIVEREPASPFPPAAEDASPPLPSILEIAEICRFGGSVKAYRENDKNDINDKITGCAGGPGEWAEWLSRLLLTRPPGDVPRRRWRQFVGNARRLLEDGTLDEAVRLGWTTLDLFGCDESKPFARVDQMGLIWFIQGDHLVSMSSSAAIIETVSGARLTYRRKTEGAGQVAVWKLFSAGGGDAKAIDVAREED
jgi:hypothetical protein